MTNKHCLIYETLGKVSDLKVMESASDGLIRLEGVFGVCGVKNQNNRVYDKDNYRQMVESLQQVIKETGCPGELEHPNSMNINLENVSHKIESIQMNEDGTKAVTAYFIMGRSENSRNRVFVEDGEGIRTQAFDPSKLSDPSLIIYAPVRVLGDKTIVTNGDQTDTVYDLMKQGKTFEESLRTREFEPDGPNYTPRISGLMTVSSGKYEYAMSILKSHNGNPDQCDRYTFSYDAPVAGEGHFIHTYMKDGNPLPSFEGEPTWVKISGNIDEFTDMIWNNLNQDNKVSLFVRYIDIATGEYETRIINKNK